MKNKDGGYLVFITGIDIKARGGQEIYIAREWRTASDLFELFVFADDGSPCGGLEKELRR